MLSGVLTLPKVAQRVEGVIPPIITPYFNGEFDARSFKKVADNMIEHGVDGLFVLGYNGEFDRISLEEKRNIINIVTRNYAGRTMLFVGTTGNNLDETIELSSFVSKQDGITALVVAPEYGNFNQESYYMDELLANTDGKTKFVLYNNPGITNGRDIPLEDIAFQRKNPRIKE